MAGAEKLFEQIIAAGWAGLERWSKDKEPETDELEFKGRDHKSPDLGKFGRSNISRAVSAFANTSGGVLLLGIENLRVGGADCAGKLEPTKGLKQHVALIDAHLLRASDPVVPARVKGIETYAGSDEGIPVVFVPQCDGGPYRAKCAGDEWSNHYFMRVGANTGLISHSILSSMFGRPPPPKLELDVRRVDPRRYELHLRNTGRGAAKNAAVRFAVWSLLDGKFADYPGLAFEHVEPLWRRGARARGVDTRAYWIVELEPGALVYPDDELHVCTFTLTALYERIHISGRLDAGDAQPARFSGVCPFANGDRQTIGDDLNSRF